MAKFERLKKSYSDNLNDIDVKEILAKFKYNPETGDVYRLRNKQKNIWVLCVQKKLPPGDIVTWKRKHVALKNIAWICYYKELPKEKILFKDNDCGNLKIDNLALYSDLRKYGFIRINQDKNDKFYIAKVTHVKNKYLKQRKFKKKADAKKWALEHLTFYNKQLAESEATALSQSEVKETGVLGVYYYVPKDNYQVKIYVDGKFTHHCYAKNIEDARAKQIEGQTESDLIWGRKDFKKEDLNDKNI